eukprot:105922-Alexandrium_andersonii.AAC.1
MPPRPPPPFANASSKRSELELPNMSNCFRRSELELRGPRNGHKCSTLQDIVRGTRRRFVN